MTLVGQHIGQ